MTSEFFHKRLMPLEGKLVTGGNVMDKTSNAEPKRNKTKVHPMLGKRDDRPMHQRRDMIRKKQRSK
jgi:hypothetical protein